MVWFDRTVFRQTNSRRFDVRSAIQHASISGFDLATNAKIERIPVCPLAVRHCSVP